MRKALILATTAAVLGGSLLAYNVYAQQQPPARSRWQPSAADIGAFANARIAAIHAGLALSSEQEALWPPVETVLKDIAKRRAERFEKFRAERQAQTPAQPPPGPDANPRSAYAAGCDHPYAPRRRIYG